MHSPSSLKRKGEKKKKTIATFLKRGYRQIQNIYIYIYIYSRGCSRVLNTAIGHRYSLI